MAEPNELVSPNPTADAGGAEPPHEEEERLGEWARPDAPTPTHPSGPPHQMDDNPRFTVIDKRFWVGRERLSDGQDAGMVTPGSRLPTYVEQLHGQLEEKERLLKTRLAEMRHEQEELRRRLTRDVEQRVELATGNLLADFLPVLDNLERALGSAEQASDAAALREGVRLVTAQFLSVLGRYGLKLLDRQGQPFDPSLDEAIATVTVKEPSQDNLVLQEWEKGYTLHEKVLRPAKVAVAKLAPED